jgi:hypothetical protein
MYVELSKAYNMYAKGQYKQQSTQLILLALSNTKKEKHFSASKYSHLPFNSLKQEAQQILHGVTLHLFRFQIFILSCAAQ